MDIETYEQLRSALDSLVRAQFGERAWVQEIFIYQDALVYQDGNGKLWKVGYAHDEAGKWVVRGNSVEVQRQVTFPPVR